MSVNDVVSALATARRVIQLYPATHPEHDAALDVLVSAVSDATASGPLTLNWHQGRLYSESVALPADVRGADILAEAFESRSIESLTIQPGLARADALGLTQVLSLRASDTLDIEAELAQRGVIGVTISLLEKEDDTEREERERQRKSDRSMYQRAIAALRNVQARLASGGGDIGETGALVGPVMQRLLSDPSAVLGLATIRETSERDLFHSLNVMIYTLALGHRLGLPEEGLESLGLSALMHDVGKTAFDAGDPSQTAHMRSLHPVVGAEILQRVALEDPAPMLVAYEHHMTVDGTGWPNREDGYTAHPYSRIVAIADRYENLTSAHAGEPSLTPDKAIMQVLREGGTRLDAFFVRLFAAALGAFPVGCLVRLSDQSVGVVCRPGEEPLAPTVRLAYDSKGFELDSPEDLDLAHSNVRIVEVLRPEALNVRVAEKL